MSYASLLDVEFSLKSDDPMFKIHIEPMSAQVRGRIQDQQQCGKPTEIGPDHLKIASNLNENE